MTESSTSVLSFVTVIEKIHVASTSHDRKLAREATPVNESDPCPDPSPQTAIVTELTGGEVGRWLVTTQHSRHLFDLENRTVERIPGPEAQAMDDDGIQSLLEIRTCRVGQRGYWTIRSDDDLIEYYWHLSSQIRSIERLDDVP